MPNIGPPPPAAIIRASASPPVISLVTFPPRVWLFGRPPLDPGPPARRRCNGDARMAWIYLLLAGLCEIGWPIGLKLGWTDEGLRAKWIAFALVSITLSGALLLIAQRTIPIGTAYAVWTGIGAVGTFIVGVAAFGDPATVTRLLGVALITAGIVTLRLG